MTYKVISVDTGSGTTLDVKDGGAPIHVKHHTHGTTIIWALTGNAAGGAFNPITKDETSGFCWIDESSVPKIFGKAVSGNKVIVLFDDHTSGSTNTPVLPYQLNATIDGVNYSTTSSSATETINNPGIKNE